MELVCDYMRDDTLRHALNELTAKTFYFDFESWVTNGYFEGDYIPYSFIEDGKIVSNVSANRMIFLQNGVRKNYIQIGTVMTDKAYRKQRLARKLLAHVIEQYKNECDSFYLFANLDAVDFYAKCGFSKEVEYCYSVKDEFCGEKSKSIGENFIPVDASYKQMKQKYMDMVRHSAVNSSMEQINKFSLQMFYTVDMENVYYAKDIDCFIIAEVENDVLLLQSVICRNKVMLSEILQRVGTKYHKCRLGFTPASDDMYMCISERYNGENEYRLFYLGEKMESIMHEKIYFPELSHA